MNVFTLELKYIETIYTYFIHKQIDRHSVDRTARLDLVTNHRYNIKYLFGMLRTELWAKIKREFFPSILNRQNKLAINGKSKGEKQLCFGLVQTQIGLVLGYAGRMFKFPENHLIYTIYFTFYATRFFKCRIQLICNLVGFSICQQWADYAYLWIICFFVFICHNSWTTLARTIWTHTIYTHIYIRYLYLLNSQKPTHICTRVLKSAQSDT